MNRDWGALDDELLDILRTVHVSMDGGANQIKAVNDLRVLMRKAADEPPPPPLDWRDPPKRREL